MKKKTNLFYNCIKMNHLRSCIIGNQLKALQNCKAYDFLIFMLCCLWSVTGNLWKTLNECGKLKWSLTLRLLTGTIKERKIFLYFFSHSISICLLSGYSIKKLKILYNILKSKISFYINRYKHVKIHWNYKFLMECLKIYIGKKTVDSWNTKQSFEGNCAKKIIIRAKP